MCSVTVEMVCSSPNEQAFATLTGFWTTKTPVHKLKYTTWKWKLWVEQESKCVNPFLDRIACWLLENGYSGIDTYRHNLNWCNSLPYWAKNNTICIFSWPVHTPGGNNSDYPCFTHKYSSHTKKTSILEK